jgi:hypothetical protein
MRRYIAYIVVFLSTSEARNSRSPTPPDGALATAVRAQGQPIRTTRDACFAKRQASGQGGRGLLRLVRSERLARRFGEAR